MHGVPSTCCHVDTKKIIRLPTNGKPGRDTIEFGLRQDCTWGKSASIWPSPRGRHLRQCKDVMKIPYHYPILPAGAWHFRTRSGICHRVFLDTMATLVSSSSRRDLIQCFKAYFDCAPQVAAPSAALPCQPCCRCRYLSGPKPNAVPDLFPACPLMNLQ